MTILFVPTGDGGDLNGDGATTAGDEPTLRHDGPAVGGARRLSTKWGQPGRRRPWPGLVTGALGVAVLATFAATFLGTTGTGSQPASSKKRLLSSIAATVGVAKVATGSVTSQVTLTGTVGTGEGPVSITPAGSGIVTSLSMVVGQTVEAGQVVAQLSDTQGAASKQAVAQAQLAQAQAQLAQAQSPQAQPAAVAQAQDQVATAQAALSDAQAKQTADEAVPTTTAEQLSVDAAAVTEAESELAAAQQQLASAQDPPGASPAEVQADQAAVNAAQANLDAADQAVAQLTVRAPVNGTVAQVLVPVGGAAGPTTPVATLAGGTETVTAEASPMTTATLGGAIGGSGTASLAVPGAATSVTATLASIAPSADPATQQTAVTFLTNAALQPGAPVTVTVDLPKPSGAVVPADAVVHTSGKAGVFVVTHVLNPSALGIKLPKAVPSGTELGTATFRSITAGATSNGQTQVLTGVSVGQTIVTTGQTDLSGLAGPKKVAIMPTAAPGAAATPDATASKTGRGKLATSGVDVTVVAVHGRKVTVSTPIGRKTFTVPAHLTITHDGKPVPLDHLRKGNVVKITLRRDQGKLTVTSAKLQ